MLSAYGASSASGAMAKTGGSQNSRVRARSRRSPRTARSPASGEVRVVARAGRGRVPKRSRRAEQRNPAAVRAMAARGSRTVSSSPPAPKPRSRALWATIRISERPRTKASPRPRTSAREALRVPWNRGAAKAMALRRTRSPATGVPGQTMAAAQPAHSRSQATRTRRAGWRSASGASRVPPRAYGRKPRAKVSALSRGEPVVRKTRTVRAISATTVPRTDIRWAAKTYRNSRTRKTQR